MLQCKWKGKHIATCALRQTRTGLFFPCVPCISLATIGRELGAFSQRAMCDLGCCKIVAPCPPQTKARRNWHFGRPQDRLLHQVLWLHMFLELSNERSYCSTNQCGILQWSCSVETSYLLERSGSHPRISQSSWKPCVGFLVAALDAKEKFVHKTGALSQAYAWPFRAAARAVSVFRPFLI